MFRCLRSLFAPPAGLATALLAACVLAAPARAADVPAPVTRAAELHAGDVAGYVGFETRADMALDAPLMKRATEWRAWVIAKDGEPVETTLLTLTHDAKPAPEKERAEMQGHMNDRARQQRDGLDYPFVRRHVAAYAFEPATCERCEEGEQAFAFRAVRRDRRHGDGVMVIGRDGRVRRVTFEPCEKPPRVETAQVKLEATPLGANWWGVTRVRARYAGGVGPLQGAMTLAQRQLGHRRYPSLEAARAAAVR